MKYVSYIIAAILLIACGRPNKELQERIIHSDSVAINYFRGDGTMDTVVMVRIIRDKPQIEKLATLIARHPIEKAYKCGYDGSLHFFKLNQVVQDIDFRMNADNCMHFSFLQYGQKQETALSGEAKALINSLRK